MQLPKIKCILPEVGFEPTLANETELKSAALDHSAIQAPAHVIRDQIISDHITSRGAQMEK